MKAVTVIGCGHGGQALAADLSRRGCDVTLYAHPKHPGSIKAIAHAGGIICKGVINEFVPIKKMTTSLPQALSRSETIFIALPSFTHEAIFIEMLPFIKPGQTIITLAANFASLILLKLLLKINKTADIGLIDMASLPYVSRSDNKGTVEIIAIKKKLGAASIPTVDITRHIKALTPIFPSTIVPFRDVLSLGMNMTNGIVHPVVTLFNAGRIHKEKKPFHFYSDGITPEIARVVTELDAERMRIGKSLGLEMYRFLDLHAKYYGEQYDSIYQFYRESPAHQTLLSPTSSRERFITEDVGGSLVAWQSLGKLVSAQSCILSNLINMASILNNTNYFCTGTNLVRLNLHDKTLDEIKQYVSSGIAPNHFSGSWYDDPSFYATKQPIALDGAM